jgi:hypothetical protein
MKKLGVDIERTVLNKHKFREADVTKDTVKKFNITKALAEVAELEKELTPNPSFQLIQALNFKYQQVIEYYSAIESETENTMVYLGKIKNLMMIEDKQTSDASKTSSQPSE